MSRFGQTEKAIFAIAFMTLLAFSYFLYDDSLLFPKENNRQLELIGDVTTSLNDVRRKNLDTFTWIPASRKDAVYQNDSIFTGDDSEATVQLQDGSQIKIQPNSLITLNLKNGQMNLDLRYGNLVGELAKGSSLTVKSGTDEIKLESKADAPEKPKIQFNKTHSGSVDLKLISGNVKYSDKKKSTPKVLPQNTVVAITKKGEVKQLEKPQIELKTADNANILRVTPDAPLSFEWNGKGDIAQYEMELSPSEEFSSIAFSKHSKAPQTQVTDPLAPGSYYWRVKALDHNGQVATTSTIHRMTISHLSGPQIVSPQQAQQISLEIKGNNQEPLASATEIQWRAHEHLKNFKWQIASDAEFKNILKEENTNSQVALSPKLPSGTYWVRVQGKTESQTESPWSEPVSFSLNLVAQKLERPKTPILITKNVNFKVPSAKDRNPASPTAPKMAWKPVLQTKNYILQISKDITFKEAEKYDLNSTNAAWSQYRPGKYFYRVYARGFNGLISDPSETGTIDVQVGELTLNPLQPISHIGPSPTPQETSISWSEVPFAKSYLVQFDKSKDFNSPQQLEYTSNSGLLKLSEPGLYHVRVQARTDNNEPLSDFSNVEEVLYRFRSPLAAPLLTEPFNSASIFLQNEMEPFIWLEWKKVKGATSYRIEISDKPDFSKVLITQSLKTNRFLIKENIPLGKIYWRVRAESSDDTEISDWTEKREFTLYHEKNETFVK